MSNSKKCGLAIHHASFRDPSGYIFTHEGELFRQVNKSYSENYELLMFSGLYESLVSKQLLVEHKEVECDFVEIDKAFKVIKPTYIPFISYPYEWCFSQLKDAALLTLSIQKLAISKGMILKDASSYNIQFVNGAPVFIDTLSFEKYDQSRPWIAYRQFCQHFLAPLAIMSHTDISLGKMLALYIDGIPLDLASKLLPWKSKFSLTIGVHIHAHAKTQAKYANSPNTSEEVLSSFSRRRMDLLIAGLEIAINKLEWSAGDTEWADYYDQTHNYGNEGLATKESLVDQLLQLVRPKTVWDLGANTGKFTQLAANQGSYTVAWDIDPSCVEWNYQRIKKNKNHRILPLLLDLTNPSPSLGWANSERDSFISRGPVDLIMALGLIHHLVISNNIPMDQVSKFLSSLCQYLIIEFIPKEDSQVELLLATREDIFESYNLNGFLFSFLQHFKLIEQFDIGKTKRTLILLKSKNRS